MKTMPTWQFYLPYAPHPGFIEGPEIQANTKSEARAVLKKRLGLPRLPVGAFAVRKVAR